ncbi:MAG TPA: endonuclease domain-containing protein [Stellaceae bacterium]|nr:endonuclease domain-containing protein [Stellaceae bacterium]
MTVDAARRLRRDMTDAERALWRLLRARQLSGYKFRRQQPIDRYIADFVCLAYRLIIEVDGGQHATNIAYDERRIRYLESAGFQVLRFWNNEVLENSEGVCLKILEALAAAPHPPDATRRAHPSPARGEG